MITKRKDSIISILVAILMVFAMMPMLTVTVFADGGYADCDGFKCWIEPAKGTAVIFGRAEGNTDTEISIPDSVTYNGDTYTVTEIFDSAFENDSVITKLTVASGITTIGEKAFRGCTNLDDISLPDSITDIRKECFKSTAYYDDGENWDKGILYVGKCMVEGKPEVRECIVRDGTVMIANYAFCYGAGDQYDLTSLTIPASVVKIGDCAFDTCSDLQTVSFAENCKLKTIGPSAFGDCSSLSSIAIPASVNEIDSQAFYGTGLMSIVLPEGLTIIDVQVFDGCSSLTEVTIPSTVIEIADFAFCDCPLATIHFGGSPTQWAAITGYGKPDIEPADYGKEDVYLHLSVLKGSSWIDADDLEYVTSAVINGTDTREAQVPVGVKTTIVITPAEGYMVSGVTVNNEPNPSGIDFRSWTNQETGIHTITFTPAENGSYDFSVALHEAVRVTYDLNGGTAGSGWLGIRD